MHPVVRYCLLAVGAAIAGFGVALVLDAFNSGESAPLLNRVGGAATFGFVIVLGLKQRGTLAGPPLIAGAAAALAVLFVPNLVSIPVAYLLDRLAPSVLEAIVTGPALLVWALLMTAAVGGLAGSVAYYIATRGSWSYPAGEDGSTHRKASGSETSEVRAQSGDPAQLAPASTSEAGTAPWLVQKWWIPAGIVLGFLIGAWRYGLFDPGGPPPGGPGSVTGSLFVGVAVCWAINKWVVEPWRLRRGRGG